MVEDPVAHVERLEKAHLKLQEKHAKSCDDISQMMEMLKMLTKKKQRTEAPNPQTEMICCHYTLNLIFNYYTS